MAVSSGKVFVTGSSATSDGSPGNYATVAYNAATGARLWARSYSGPGNSDDVPASVAVSPHGGRVFVTGYTSGLSSGDSDYATVAYNAATGAQLWARSYDRGGTSNGGATSVAVGPGGGRVFVTGDIENNYATVAYDAATGARLWVRGYRGIPNSRDPIGDVLVAVRGGRVFVTGTSSGARSESFDYGTVAYSAATGAQLWAKHYSNGHGSLSNPGSIAVSGGRVFVTGTSFAFASRSEYATVAYNAATGSQLWVRLYRGPGKLGNHASSVAVSPIGRTVYVTGTSATHPNGTGNYATIAYNAVTGARLWVRGYHRGHGCYFGSDASSVAVSPRGGQVFVTGTAFMPATCAYYPASSYATIAYRG